METTGQKTIWVPQTTTNVTVKDGSVSIWEQITMVPKPIKAPTGFGK